MSETYNKLNNKVTKLHLVLIKPSKYDNEGYIIQYQKGVMPSNTLAVLYGLTQDAYKQGLLGKNLHLKIEIIDDLVSRIKYKSIIKKANKNKYKTLVCLCGVQGNQFPRAMDIAAKFRKSGISVAIGGFHVSGIMSLFSELSPELKEMQNIGVTLVAGEVENTWHDILNDFLNDKLKLKYNFLDTKPELSSSKVPVLPRKHMKKFAISTLGTLDCGRGCPFNCSFCCVINVQGKKMRYRNIKGLKNAIRENYKKYNVKDYVFTDDNLARNNNWEKIFEMLIELREKENITIDFFMQIDTKSYNIPGFIQKAARAGCAQAFIGVESLNPKNLSDVGKVQNKVENYVEMNKYIQQNHIKTHAAYILGFPNDTEESIKKDLDNLINIGFDQASFFIMTPIPGSMDHKILFEQGVKMDSDLNKYDSFQPVKDHPNISRKKLLELYKYAWKKFQSNENIKKILTNSHPQNYYSALGNLIWYKHAIDIDDQHPMISGFFRIKDRKNRRPGFAREPFFRFHWQRIKERIKKIKLYIQFIKDIEEIWLATRPRAEWEIKVVNELKKIKSDLKGRIHLKDLFTAFRQAGLKRPSVFRYLLQKFIMPLNQKYMYSRDFLNKYWSNTRIKLKKGKILHVNYFNILLTFYCEMQLFITLCTKIIISKPKTYKLVLAGTGK